MGAVALSLVESAKTYFTHTGNACKKRLFPRFFQMNIFSTAIASIW
jgi:hypothetical protein